MIDHKIDNTSREMAMERPKKLHFVFIINGRYLPNPHLVQLGRRKSPRLRDVMYLMPNVLFCPQKMTPLLFQLQHQSTNIKEQHRRLIYEEYAFLIKTFKEENGMDLDNKSTSFWRTVAILAIIEFEIEGKLQLCLKRGTRSTISMKKKLKVECRVLREKRIVSESHLKIHFCDDISRSVAELNYAIEQFGY